VNVERIDLLTDFMLSLLEHVSSQKAARTLQKGMTNISRWIKITFGTPGAACSTDPAVW
jgi:predicted thioesterase